MVRPTKDKNRSVFQMTRRFIKKIIRKWNTYLAYQEFRGAQLDHVILGPELDKRFEIRFPEKLEVGYKTVISGDCFINARGGVKIGRYCHIAKGLTIYSHNHNWKSQTYIPYDDMDIEKPVSIGDCVWIGCNVTIAPGSKIGNGVIISSGAVVFGEIPSCAIIRGNPAVVIGYRDVEVFDRLYKAGMFK